VALVILESSHNDVRLNHETLNQQGHHTCYQKKLDLDPRFELIANISDPFILSNIRATEEIVAQLDLTKVQQCYSNRGSKHEPVIVLLRIAIYNLLSGFPSPSDWARNVQSCNATRFVARLSTPSKSSLYRFRDKAKFFIHELFVQVLAIANDEGFLAGDEVAVDGTYIDALASRHRLVNQATLTKRIDALENKLVVATDQAPATGERSCDPKWMATTDSGRLEQLERYQQAQDELTKRLAKNAKKRSSERLDESKVFASTSDPTVTISRNKLNVFGPLWPTQFVTHVGSRLVLAAHVFSIASDSNTIGSMIDLARSNCKVNLRTAYTDAGYTSLSDIRSCLQRSINLVAPVSENSFSERNKQEKINRTGQPPSFTKSDFLFNYDTVQCTCPNGVTLQGIKDGKRELPNGEKLQCYRFNFDPDDCQTCPLVAQCKENRESTRSVRLIEGEKVLADHKAAMTSEVLSNCRSIRAQTAEKAFADGKEKGSLRKLGCRTPTRARALVMLHVLAMNIKTLFNLRLRKQNTS
jgi:transposase